MKSQKTKYVLTEWTKDDDKLMSAVEKNHADKVHSLVVKKKVDPTKIEPNRGLSSLHLAVDKENISAVEEFLGQGLGSRIDSKDFEGFTATHHAARRGHYPILQKLLQQKPNLCIFDRKMKSALHHACEGGNLGCVQLLLAENISVHFKDRDGKTALCLAAEKGQASMCRLLIENGSDVNEVDLEGRTPLLWAAMKNHSTVCRYLLQNGADLSATDSKGRSALWYAKRNNDNELVKILQQAGTDPERDELRINSDKDSLDHPYEPIGTDLGRKEDFEIPSRSVPTAITDQSPMVPPPRPQRLPPFTGKSTSLLQLDSKQGNTIGENLGLRNDILSCKLNSDEIRDDLNKKAKRHSSLSAGLISKIIGNDDEKGGNTELNDPGNLDIGEMNLGSFREMLDDAFRKNSLLVDREWDQSEVMEDVKSVSLSIGETEEPENQTSPENPLQLVSQDFEIHLPNLSASILESIENSKTCRKGSYTPMTPASDASTSITTIAQLNARDAEALSLPRFDLTDDVLPSNFTKSTPSLSRAPTELEVQYVSKDVVPEITLPSVTAEILKQDETPEVSTEKEDDATAIGIIQPRIQSDATTHAGIFGGNPDDKLLGEHMKLLEELKMALEKRNEMELERIHLVERLKTASRSQEWIVQELSEMKNVIDAMLESLERGDATNDEIEKLKKDLERINGQLDSLLRLDLDEVEDVRLYCPSSTSESGEFASRVIRLEREKQDLASKLKEVLTENGKLYNQLVGVEKLMREAEELKEENVGLILECRDFVEVSERDSAEVEDLMRLFKETIEENDNLKNENEKLLSRLNGMNTRARDLEIEDLGGLKKENVKLIFERMQLEEAVERQSKDLLEMAEKLRISEETSRHGKVEVIREDETAKEKEAPLSRNVDDGGACDELDYRQMYEELRSESMVVLDELRAKEALVAEYNRVVEEYEELQRENARLKNSLEKKSHDVRLLNGRVQDLGDQLEEAFAEFKSAINTMQQENAEEYDRLKEENRQLRLFIRELNATLEDKDAIIAENAEQLEKRNPTMKVLEGHDETSQTEIHCDNSEGSKTSIPDNKKTRSPVYEDLRNAMFESKILVQENDKLKKQLAELEAEKSKNRVVEDSELIEENLKLKEQNEKLQFEIASLKRTISEQGAYLAYLTPHSGDMERVVFPSETGNEKVNFPGRVSNFKEKIHPVKQDDVKNQRVEVEKLTSELVILKSQVECLEKMQEVARRNEEDANAQSTKLQSLENLCSDLSSRIAEKEEKVLELSETLKEQQKDLMAARRFEDDCDLLIKEFNNVTGENYSIFGDSLASNSGRRACIVRMRDWIIEQQGRSAAEQDNLQMENKILREEARRLESEIEELQELNLDLSKEKEIFQRNSQTKLEAIQERLACESAEVAILKVALDELNAEERSLREQLDRLKEQLAAKEEEIRSGQTKALIELKTLEGQNDELKSQLQIQEDLLFEIETLTSQISNLKQQIEDKTEELEILKKIMSLEIDHLREELESSKKEIEEDAVRAKEECCALRKKYSNLLEDKEDLEKSHVSVIEGMRAELKEHHAGEIDRVNNAHAELERQHEIINNELKRLEFELEKAMMENGEAVKKIASLEKYCKELKDVNNRLKESQKISGDHDIKVVAELREINLGLREKMNSLEQKNQKLMLEREQTQLLLEMEKLKNLSVSGERGSPIRSPQNGFSPNRGALHSSSPMTRQSSFISVSPVSRHQYAAVFDRNDGMDGPDNRDVNSNLAEENRRLRKTLDKIEYGFCQPMRLRSESTQTQRNRELDAKDNAEEDADCSAAYCLSMAAGNRRLFLEVGNLQSSLRRRSSFIVHGAGSSRQNQVPLEQQRQDLEKAERAFLDAVASKSLEHLSVMISLEDDFDDVWRSRGRREKGRADGSPDSREVSLVQRLRMHGSSLRQLRDLLESVVNNEKFYDQALEEVSCHLPLLPEVDSLITVTSSSPCELLNGGESSKLLRQLQQQLMENERKYKEIIQKYRRHLICAVQGQMDPEVKESLLSFIESKKI